MSISKTSATIRGLSGIQGETTLHPQANDSKNGPNQFLNNKKGTPTIRSVVNALELLKILCDEDIFTTDSSEEFKLCQLSKRLGINMNEMSRQLRTFENCGFVERDANTHRYRLGVNAFDMGRKMLTRMNLLRQSRPVMENLARLTNESVYLAVPRGTDFLFFDHAENVQPINVVSLLLRRFPLASSAPGRLMLAYSAPDVQFSNDNLLPVTLQAIKRQGYCLDTGGLGELVVCLATPIFNSNKAMIGSLCLVGPIFRMTSAIIEKNLLPNLKEASETISSRLGYHLHHTGNIRL